MLICCQFTWKIRQCVYERIRQFVHYYSIQFLRLLVLQVERFFIVGFEEDDSARDKHMTKSIAFISDVLYLSF